MNCASCGAALPAGAAFCGNCGATVDDGVLRITLDDLDTVAQPVVQPDVTPVAGTPYVSAAAPPAMTPPPPPRYGAAFPPAQYAVPTSAPPSRGEIVGAVIGVIGAAVVILGTFLKWVDVDTMVKTPNAFRIPYGFLFDSTDSLSTDAGIGVLLAALAVVGAITSFLPKVGFLRNLCGLGVLIVAGLYLAQSNDVVSHLNSFASGLGSSGRVNLADWLGVGFYVTAFGGLLMAAGPPRRH